MIPERFKEIKARCEAGTGGCIYTFVPEDSVGMLVILTLNSATGKAHNEFIAHSFQDLPDCLDEILLGVQEMVRLQTALRNLYNDCRNEPCDEQRGKVMDEARKVLEAM